MIDALAFGAFALVAYAVISKRTADSVLTAPMWFAALGYLGALLLGEELDLHMQAEWVHLVAEIALVVRQRRVICLLQNLCDVISSEADRDFERAKEASHGSETTAADNDHAW